MENGIVLTVNHWQKVSIDVIMIAESLGCVKAYLGIISLADAEQSFQRIVPGDDEAGEVNKELASNVEKDEEEVQAQKAKDDIDFGDRRLALEVVESWVL